MLACEGSCQQKKTLKRYFFFFFLFSFVNKKGPTALIHGVRPGQWKEKAN